MSIRVVKILWSVGINKMILAANKGIDRILVHFVTDQPMLPVIMLKVALSWLIPEKSDR